jgi:carbamoyltransferase
LLILGLNAFHGDASAAIVRDGVLLAAVEEERFCRIKHWAGFPIRSIEYCLAEAGATLSDVDVVAINSDSRVNRWRKLAHVLASRPDPKLLLDRLKNRKARKSIPELLAEAFPGQTLRAPIERVEHHQAHLSSAFHVSPFEEASVVSVDGFGDFASASWGIGRAGRIEVEGKVHFPHSLGAFYQAITQYLGFPNYGDEYKVMGLAPYGTPSRLEDMRKIVLLQDDGSFKLDLKYFRHHREKIDYTWEGGNPHVGNLFSPALEELLGPRRDPKTPLTQRENDIARSCQAMYEEAFFHLLNVLQKRHKTEAVCIAGGCGNNSVANGKIRRRTAFKRVYVQSAAGDAGGAIGAAYVVHHAHGGKRGFVQDHAYWGPAFDAHEIARTMSDNRAALDEAGCSVDIIVDEAELCRRTAEAVSEGKVIGWFQGRMEWGPRALGARSIIGDPRRADMKDILNAKIKRRESFRPFAPSVLAEAVAEWFEEDDDVPFMMQVFQIAEDKRAQIPAVTHVDGSGRLQTVRARTSPRYHALISAFRHITGVPMVLNTSFNENEPVVCRPEEALSCFLRTKMDVLVLGDTLIERKA